MIRLLTRRGVQVVLLITLLCTATFMSGSERPWLKRLQFITFDTFYKLKPRDPTNNVAIVDIDEDSLATLGQWPWPRDMVATMVTKLKAMGASSVVFDMVFAEPDRTTPALVAKRLPEGPGMDQARASLESLPDNDTVFAKAIADAGNVVTGFIWSYSGQEGREPETRRGMIMTQSAFQTLSRKAATAENMIPNLPVLEKAAAGNGSFFVTTDMDGIVRRVPMILKYVPKDGSGRVLFYPSLPLEALRVAMGGQYSVQIAESRSRDLLDLLKPPLVAKIGPLRLPIDSDGQMWVYYAQQRPERYISAWKVLAGQVDKEQINGRIVMIGTSAEGLKDIRSSPLNLFVPGVEMHLNVIEQVLQGKFLSRPTEISGIEGSFIFAFGLLLILVSPFVNLFVLFGTVVALVGGVFALSWLAFIKAGVLIDPVYPSLAVMVMFVLSALLSYLKAEYERREIRGAFGLYISPDFMKELTKNPEKLQLGGEIKPLTIMFTDIRNFTAIAEGMSPQTLINTMNDFLTPMSDEVMRARGTIDKYMGDAMMAFWNAPLDVEDHEKLAVRAALSMRNILAPVNARLKKQAEAEGRNFFPLNCGIGINTGPVAVGNMGSRQRFAYSVLGDAVNLASRLEGQTKTYGVNILLGENTADKVADFAVLEIDFIRVKGKAEPSRIYTVLGDEKAAAKPAFRNWQLTHNAFLSAYRAGKFALAAEHLATARAMDAEDRLGDYYMVFDLRIRDFLHNPPSAAWDGVYLATSK